MSRVKLTDAVVQKALLPVDKAEAVLWDSELVGFGLRIRPTAKTWIVAYRPVGAGRASNMKRFRLGSPSTIKTATEARGLARVVLGKVAAGQDPAAERADEKRRERSRLGDALDAYDRDLERRSYVNRPMVIAGLRTRLKPLLDREAQTITGAQLAAIVEKIEASGKRGAAEQFRSKARTFFGFIQTKLKLIEVNPLAGHRKERATKADRLAREQHGRALSDVEFVAVWRASDPATVFGRLTRFWMLTGCRRGEGVGLERPMVDRTAQTITLPAVLTKQGRAHVVPITPLLADLLDGCPVVAGTDLIFPSSKTGGKISGWRPMREKLEAAAGVHFTAHDLRRTFRTGLSRLGIDDPVGELAIGHARKDLEARYNRDTAAAAIRRAFEAWDTHVAGLLAADAAKRAGAA